MLFPVGNVPLGNRAGRKSLYFLVLQLAVVPACLSLLAEQAAAVKLRAEAVITSGLNRPIFATTAPGVSDSLFIVEQVRQDIRIFDQQTNQLTTFLDLSTAQPGSGLGNGERGLKGLAFHPEYETNGKFYVHQYSTANDVVNILEFTRSTTNPLVADPTTQKTVLTFSHTQTGTNGDHSAGWIGFSPNDDFLYIPTGDGGSGGNFQGLPAQDLNDLRGKVLRIDIDGDDFPADPDRNYAIPADNPFALSGGAPEIVASGLRHPFRSSIDRETGDLYFGDVGNNRFEEINRYETSTMEHRNYGWRSYEGFDLNPAFAGDPLPTDPIDPLVAYSHEPDPNNQGAAVIGGYVYRGTDLPEFVGDYIYVDFRRNQFLTFDSTGDASDLVDRSVELRNPTSPNGNYGGVASFVEDADGELYFLDIFNNSLYAIVAGVEGDYDVNGVVEAADYDLWRETFGETSDLRADGNDDGVVDAIDYAIWRDNFTPPAAAQLGEQQVPEPTTAGLLGVAIAWICRANGRRR